ncbi:hypothetical protein Cgig2_020672 [Carnegiea gigantea]|uniref:DRBM domain-containing protein n=1 Tax=Carnegiea gigantea TaxID=171969 RepID=A0A9Q1GQM8_9CARY|nr:hypothetical protein Cgig2_020672 [Carnegiea gigantea]
MTEQATPSPTNSGQGLQQQQPQLSSNQDSLPYKNRLQEFTQRAKIPLPVYRTVNEGQSHAPKFKSTVVVDGITYASVNAHSSRRAAEQDVAKVALEGISRKINNWVTNKMNEEGFPPIYEEKVICKSILHEFAAKMNLEKPKYNTVRFEGVLPGFVSSVVFGGVTCTGEACKSKKEAEQCAARESRSEVDVGVCPVGLDSGNSTGASATREATSGDKAANKAGNLIGNAAMEAPQASDVHPLGSSATREAASGDNHSDKAGNLIGNAAPEAHEGKASDICLLTASATIEEASVDKDVNKAGDLVINPASEAPEGQASDVYSVQVKPNLDVLTCNKKRKSKRKKAAGKKLKTESDYICHTYFGCKKRAIKKWHQGGSGRQLSMVVYIWISSNNTLNGDGALDGYLGAWKALEQQMSSKLDCYLPAL